MENKNEEIENLMSLYRSWKTETPAKKESDNAFECAYCGRNFRTPVSRMNHEEHCGRGF